MTKILQIFVKIKDLKLVLVVMAEDTANLENVSVKLDTVVKIVTFNVMVF